MSDIEKLFYELNDKGYVYAVWLLSWTIGFELNFYSVQTNCKFVIIRSFEVNYLSEESVKGLVYTRESVSAGRKCWNMFFVNGVFCLRGGLSTLQ